MTYREITKSDIGKPTIYAFGKTWPVSSFLGQVLPCDVGKRVFLVGDILQVENNEQRDRRENIMARKDFLPQCNNWHEMSRCPNRAEFMLQCNGKDNPGGWVCHEHATAILAEYTPHQEELGFGQWTVRELDKYGR